MSHSPETIASKDSAMLIRSEEERQLLLAEAKSLSCRKSEKAWKDRPQINKLERSLESNFQTFLEKE